MVARQWRRRSRALVAGGIIIEETYQLVLGKKRFFAGPPRAQDATQAEPKTQVQNRYLGHPAEKSNPGPRDKTGTWGTRRRRATQDPGTKPVLGHPAEKSNPRPRYKTGTGAPGGEEQPKTQAHTPCLGHPPRRTWPDELTA